MKKTILIIILISLLMTTGVNAAYKEFKKKDIEVLIDTTSTNIFYEYHNNKSYAEVNDNNVKEAKIKYKAKVEELSKPVAILKLHHRNKPDKKWKKSKPYKKNGKYYELPLLMYDNGTYWYEFWTEHLTDFYVNSTNLTLQQCWVQINNTGDSCVINQENYSETFNASIEISFGNSIASQVIVNNTYLDFNGSKAKNTGAGGLCYGAIGNFMYNHTVRNLNCERSGTEFNPSGAMFDSSFYNINITNITNAKIGMVLKGDNLTATNVKIDGGNTTSNPLLMWTTGARPSKSINLENITILNYVGPNKCIVCSGCTNVTDSVFRNILIEDSCYQDNSFNMRAINAFENLLFENIQIINTGSINSTFPGFRIHANNEVSNVTIRNVTIINYSLSQTWRTDIFTATYNSLTYSSTLLLSNSGSGNTVITQVNQDVTGPESLGRPGNGVRNYSLWLINGAVLDYTVLALEGGPNTCAAVAAFLGGTCDAQIDNVLVANGLADYTTGTPVWSNITLANSLRMDYVLGSTRPHLSVNRFSDTKIVNSTFFVSSSYAGANALELNGSVSGGVVWQNNFLNTDAFFQNEGDINFCTSDTVGNFWGNFSGRDPPSSDCGDIMLPEYEGQGLIVCERDQSSSSYYNQYLRYNWTLLSPSNTTLHSEESSNCYYDIPSAFEDGSNTVRVTPFINVASPVSERVWGREKVDSNFEVIASIFLILVGISAVLILAFRHLEGDVIFPIRLLYLFASFMILIVAVWIGYLWAEMVAVSNELIDIIYVVLLWCFIILVGYVFIYLVFFAIMSWQQKRKKSIFDE